MSDKIKVEWEKLPSGDLAVTVQGEPDPVLTPASRDHWNILLRRLARLGNDDSEEYDEIVGQLEEDRRALREQLRDTEKVLVEEIGKGVVREVENRRLRAIVDRLGGEGLADIAKSVAEIAADAPLLSREQVEREFQLMFLERTKENQIIREETIKRSYLRLYDAVEALSPEGWERIARLMEEHLMSGHFCLTLAALRAEMEAGDG